MQNLLRLLGLALVLAASPATAQVTPGSADIGEFFQSFGRQGSLAVTITIANPAVITSAAHGMTAANNNCTITNFTTSGALPTGLTVGTNYYLTVTGTTTYVVSTSIANCFAGTFVTTTGTQSGSHTALFAGAYTASATPVDVAALNLSQGDWDVQCMLYFDPAVGTTATNYLGWTNNVAATGNFVAGGYATLNLPSLTGTNLTGSPGLSPMTRWLLASPTIIYCGGRMNFSGTAPNIYGAIRARRVH